MPPILVIDIGTFVKQLYAAALHDALKNNPTKDD